MAGLAKDVAIIIQKVQIWRENDDLLKCFLEYSQIFNEIRIEHYHRVVHRLLPTHTDAEARETTKTTKVDEPMFKHQLMTRRMN